jgi:hypothetical protein
MARKARSMQAALPNNVLVRDMNPGNPDTKYMGFEPIFTTQPNVEDRKITVVKSLGWYNWFYGRKEAKNIMVEYLEIKGKADQAKLMRKVQDIEFALPSIQWLARLSLRGLILTDDENQKIDTEISRLLNTVTDPTKKNSLTGDNDIVVEKENTNRPNIQEIMRERAHEASGEIEGLFDQYLLEGNIQPETVNVVGILTEHNIMPQHTGILVEHWKKRRDEYELVQKGTDIQLKEGYGQYGKVAMRNLIKFCDSVLAGINSYVSVKKVNRAPRKRKAVPIEKVVGKLQYLKTFEDKASKLNLVSVSPTKLHGSTEAWVYDTAKRKLYHFVADDYAKTFTIKGNTLLGFDTVQSEMKTLRKPAEQLKEIMGSKPAARKFFKEIKAVGASPKGRFNKDMVILKCF